MELARPVALALGCPPHGGGPREGARHAHADHAREGRAEANVAGVLRAAGLRAIEGAHVVVVDNMVTTGATMRAAMAAASSAGAASVTGLALSRMPRLNPRRSITARTLRATAASPSPRTSPRALSTAPGPESHSPRPAGIACIASSASACAASPR